MPKWLACTLLGLVTVAFIGAVWFFSFHQRASEERVTRVVYAKYGRAGAPIRCVAQNGNHSTFHCLSPRFGDDPSCLPVDVDAFGNISVPGEVATCE